MKGIKLDYCEEGGSEWCTKSRSRPQVLMILFDYGTYHVLVLAFGRQLLHTEQASLFCSVIG